jgi:dienelactone hydrolase
MMPKLFLLIVNFFSFIFLILIACSSSFSETIKLELSEKKYGVSTVPVELIFPENPIKQPIPLIILQHGSVRDAGHVFDGIVKTDVQMKNLAKSSLKNGFAVALVDAFYKKNLKGSQKTKQPYAQFYAKQIASHLSKNIKLDPNNFFYAGFSYGGRAAVMLMNDLEFGDSKKWAGVIALEPPCNMFYKPRNFGTPLLVIKGGKSHYEPKPCKTMTDLYISAGADANFELFPESNHYFSRNGKIGKGIAFNGCGDNPVIISKNNSFKFLDGSVATPKIIRKKCFTKTGGSGKTREDLELVIDASISFFKLKLN